MQQQPLLRSCVNFLFPQCNYKDSLNVQFASGPPIDIRIMDFEFRSNKVE